MQLTPRRPSWSGRARALTWSVSLTALCMVALELSGASTASSPSAAGGAAGVSSTAAFRIHSGALSTNSVLPWSTRHQPTSSTTTSTTTTSTTTTTTAPGAQTSCGGGANIAKISGGTWSCTFDDEFNGTQLDTRKWVVQRTATSGYVTGPTTYPACYVDSPNNVSVSDGTLNLTVRKEASPFTCVDPYGNFTTQYTSGMVSTYGLFNQTYGLFEVRAKLPAVTAKGLQETLWLWPQNATKYGAWPGSGEIDFAEFYSQYSNLDVPYIHYNSASTDPNVTAHDCTIDISQFNTYDVQWTPSSITIYYNGQTCLTDNWDPASPLVKPQPFDQPFVIALTQALGIGTNAFDPNVTPVPATTQVDYVRAWS